MRRRLKTSSFLIAISLALAAGSNSFAKAPRSKDIMRPVDTEAGSIADPNGMLRVDLETSVDIDVTGQPAIVVYNRIKSLVGLDFGFVKGVDPNQIVTVKASGPARDVLKVFGTAARVRFEVNGPMQMRVLEARGGPVRKPPAEPPPVKRN